MSRFSIGLLALATCALVSAAIQPAWACDALCQQRGASAEEVLLIDAVFKTISAGRAVSGESVILDI